MRSPRSGSGWDGSRQLREIAQGGDAGQEEVGATPGPHELRQAAVARADRAGGCGEGAAAAVAASGQRVRVVIQAVERRVVQPGVLHELELPGQAGGQADEVDAGRLAGAVPGSRAVAAAAADEAVEAIYVQGRAGSRLRVQRVTRIGPADVRAERAGHSQRVGVVIAEVVVGGERWVVPVRRLDQRGT